MLTKEKFLDLVETVASTADPKQENTLQIIQYQRAHNLLKEPYASLDDEQASALYREQAISSYKKFAELEERAWQEYLNRATPG